MFIWRDDIRTFHSSSFIPSHPCGLYHLVAFQLETSNRGEAGGADLISDMSILATGGALSV